MDADGPSWAHNVRLLAVNHDGEQIAVDIYGGDRGLVGTVLYRPETSSAYRDVLATLLFWKERRTPLTYLCRDGVASLRDDEASFREAMEPGI
ncbi:MAG TPA: hypothetical protein VM345_00755 [Acidimicrobiales bacterium]|jgi:hypothetical protein|nr:hypothetical protein [Acidimicrobiales bacterium]